MRLDARHIERDALGDDEAPGFAALVAAAVKAAGRRWVLDGAPYDEVLKQTISAITDAVQRVVRAWMASLR